MGSDAHRITFLQPVHTWTAASASGESTPWRRFSSAKEAVLYVDITAMTGDDPMIEIMAQDSHDASTPYDLSPLPPIIATGRYRLSLSGFGDYLRIKFTISGTTPAITGTADILGKT